MNKASFSPSKRRSIFLKCIVISLALHLIGLFLFYQHPLLLDFSAKSLFKNGPSSPVPIEIDKFTWEEKNKNLKETFDQIVLPHHALPYDLKNDFSGEKKPLSQEISENISMQLPDYLTQSEDLTFFPRDSSSEFSSDELEQIHIPRTSSLSLVPLTLDITNDFSVKIEDLSIPSFFEEEEKDDDSYASMQEGTYIPTQESANGGISFERAVDLARQNFLKKQESFLDAIDPFESIQYKNKDHLLIWPKSALSYSGQELKELESAPLPDIESYSLPVSALPVRIHDDFKVDVYLLPGSEKEHIFSLTLLPNIPLKTEEFKQNFLFLIDRSNATEKHRYTVFKKGVLKSLSSLKEGDFFNIVLFDHKITRLSEKNLSFSKSSLQKAEEFLEKQEHGGFFSKSDIYPSLTKIIPADLPENEIHLVILMSEDENLFNFTKQQKEMHQWMEKTHGKISLYLAGIGKTPELASLDLLSTLNKGHLIYSDTYASFPRKLAKKISTLHHPLASDLIVNAITTDPEATIDFYPPSHRLPILYNHEPYTLIGKTDTLCDFTLLIQGRYDKQWIALEKKISFKNAKKAPSSLEKQWTIQQASIYYDLFLKQGKSSYLQQANEVLKPYKNEVFFK